MPLSETDKKFYLDEARKNLRDVLARVGEEYEQVDASYIRRRETLGRIGGEQRAIEAEAVANLYKQIGELNILKDSPYFVRCDVKFNDKKETETLFFSRVSFPQKSIFSWVAPAAAICFENPGEFSISVPGNRKRTGKLLRKDQFMIVKAAIRNMTHESLREPRVLIYQESALKKKTGFILPEIVEQMERSQDVIIRADHRGSFLISGPAGSGKTTLALHRVAFLAQSPETAHLFRSEKDMIVFVNDIRTKNYFSGLLPELGVENVVITTFAEWALNNLGLSDLEFVSRYGNGEDEKDWYEFSKYAAVRAESPAHNKNPFASLESVYKKCLDQSLLKLWRQQKKEMVLDRMDLTILLRSYIAEKGLFSRVHAANFRSRREYNPLRYSLVLMDEVENYLPEQIDLIQRFIDPQFKAMIYVGDFAQQTALCTLRSWDAVGEKFAEGRAVVLSKIYRSTKQILEYIDGLGYHAEIPVNAASGKAVEEHVVSSKKEELAYVRELIAANGDRTIGVLTKSPEYLAEFSQEFSSNKNVHILSIGESQGVEFDVACFVGVNKNIFVPQEFLGQNSEFDMERKRVNRDLIYVALTRAMQELHVLGVDPLKDIIRQLNSA